MEQIQALIVLTISCVGYSNPKNIEEKITFWVNDLNLIFTKEFVNNLRSDPTKTLGLIILLTCIYIIICMMYVYGAYKCNNVLMMPYIVAELVRLIAFTVLVITLLLTLKKNTMDIGLLIGASVLGGFILLGMFYLWVCAANLPIVINEKEHDEYVATITKLEELLQETKPKTLIGFDYVPRSNYNEALYSKHIHRFQ
ncbi:PREDICTED: uncharacterized protein LOC106128411 isoform X2 [Papilio xuthus]|uniref:Uncharacterized protein LOC106128411 isoform X2 n=1 Tax=Papilio xuthus TaxID=66420 RepID=A0AAJ6ZZ86_PAPXU|nr:PREDICTED: uncharacterized protein LOC106128411 isoform X2 [Papilio xuthus]